MEEHGIANEGYSTACTYYGLANSYFSDSYWNRDYRNNPGTDFSSGL